MRESYAGLFAGMALAVVLVYLFLVINFQSWIDPLIVLMAVPFALGGVIWMLFLTQTHLSVPALMGTLMCIGLTTANSILVVTFRQPAHGGGRSTRRRRPSTAGYTRLRPVLMTAGAMILGMIPDGPRRRRRRRAERAARPRRHRRPAVRHLRHAGLRADHVPAAAPPPAVAAAEHMPRRVPPLPAIKAHEETRTDSGSHVRTPIRSRTVPPATAHPRSGLRTRIPAAPEEAAGISERPASHSFT